MAATTDWRQAADFAQFGGHRPGTALDAIEGAQPSVVLEPFEPAQVAAALAWASRERLQTVVRGRGSKLGWGRPPSHVDIVLSTARLNRAIEHRYGDLTVTVAAGMALADLNQQLAQHGQWLPLDTPFTDSTIGGVIATNEAGPLRHRYGTPRDLLIGMTMALTDGTLVKSGGHVVKNVAGYDLAKLMSGSFGALAVIVDATFKLLPVPATACTLVARYTDAKVLAADAAQVAASQLEPVAIDIRALLGPVVGGSECQLAVRFATSREATRAQTSAARALLRGSVDELEGVREGAWWSEQVRRPWTSPGTTLRLSWLPASLPDVVQCVHDLQRSTGVAMELTARAGVGTGFLRIEGEDGAAAVIEQLRAQDGLLGHVVVLRAGGDIKRAVDVWGEMGSVSGVLQSIKRTFDPAGILNASRGPI
jgi:glycolate oxidase FAD binding subunit